MSKRTDDLIKAFQLVIMEQLAKVESVDNLFDDRKSARLIGSITTALRELGIKAEEVMTEELMANYFSNAEEASRLLSGKGVDVETVAYGKDGSLSAPFAARIHREALEELVDDTMMDLSAMIRTTEQSVNVTVKESIEATRNSLTTSRITGENMKKARTRLQRSLLDKGFTAFTTIDNKQLPLDFYSSVVVNTKIRDAAIKGSSTRYSQLGYDLVRIKENSDSCPVCSPYKDLVVSLGKSSSGFRSDIALPPYHPNCFGAIEPVLDDELTDAMIAREKGKTDAFDPSVDKRSKADKEEYQRSQQKNRERNAEKKQFMNWTATLGADAPKTLGAFRRMKRSNTTKFQELQSQHRSVSQTLRRGD